MAKVALCDYQLALEVAVATLLFQQGKDLLYGAVRFPSRAAPARLVQVGHFNLCLPTALLAPVVLWFWAQGLLMQAILVPFQCRPERPVGAMRARYPCKQAWVVLVPVGLLLSLPGAALVKVVPGVRLSWLQVREAPAVISTSRVVLAVLALAALFALPQVAAHWAVAAVTCSSLQAL